MVDQSAIATLTIILGSPASGKTTLARRLAAEFGIPCLCKDDVKEALFESLGTGDRGWSRALSRASFAALIAVAAAQRAAGVSCIVEGNFRPEHAPALLSAAAPGAGVLQIRCRAEPDELARRFAARERHPGHLDCQLDGELRAERAAQPDPPFLELPGPRIDHPGGGPAAAADILRRVSTWLREAGRAGY
jgi:predicted kinase